MARPRQFNVDDALMAAMQAFWRRGYDATSLADLMAATGLQKGSLYQAFGDKHALFMMALGRYLEQRAQAQRQALAQASSPKEALLVWLSEAIDVASDPQRDGQGCMAVNTIVELAPHDPQAAQRLEDHVQRIIQRLAEIISEGQRLGELRRDVDAHDLSQCLLIFLTGLTASLRGPLDKTTAQRLAQIALQLME